MICTAILAAVLTVAPGRCAYVGVDGRVRVLDAGKTRVLGPGRQPRWSPNGKFLAYWEDDEGRPSRFGQTPLFRVPASGGAPVLVADGEASDPHWSADGALLFFLRRREGLSEVASCPATGAKGPAKTVFRQPKSVFGLQPDGQGAWVCHDLETVYRFDSKGKLLSTVKADEVTGLEAGTYAVDRFAPRPGFSNQWLYTSRVAPPGEGAVPDEESSGIYLWDASARTRRLLTDPRWFAEDPCWAADGESFVFSGKPGGPLSTQDPGVYRLGAAGGKAEKFAVGREPSCAR